MDMEEGVPRKKVCGIGARPRGFRGGAILVRPEGRAPRRSLLGCCTGRCAQEQNQVALLKGSSISGGNQMSMGL